MVYAQARLAEQRIRVIGTARAEGGVIRLADNVRVLNGFHHSLPAESVLRF